MGKQKHKDEELNDFIVTTDENSFDSSDDWGAASDSEGEIDSEAVNSSDDELQDELANLGINQRCDTVERGKDPRATQGSARSYKARKHYPRSLQHDNPSRHLRKNRRALTIKA